MTNAQRFIQIGNMSDVEREALRKIEEARIVAKIEAARQRLADVPHYVSVEHQDGAQSIPLSFAIRVF